MFLKKTSFRFPVSKLQPLLKYVQWDDKNRCPLNFKTGNWLYDDYKVYDCWKNTEFHKLLNSIPYDVGEARLMKLDPGVCYRSHADADDRLHINICSNPYSFLINLNDNKMHQLVDDDYLYYMDGSYIHTAANFGSTPRIQLVIRVRLKRQKLNNGCNVIIKFTKPPNNLRYLLDQSISPLINKMCKSGEIGFFNLFTSDSIQLYIDKAGLIKIQTQLDNSYIHYTIDTA